MTEIKKVNSLEELRRYDVVESSMEGKKLSNPAILESQNFEWYNFVKKNEKNENILKIEISDSYPFEGKNGIVEIGGKNTILKEYTPNDTGYYHYRQFLVNNGLWRKIN